MLATLPCRSTNASSVQLESVGEAVDTWDAYTSSINEAIIEALTARKMALRDYVKVQALADTWERRQAALENSCSDLAREALLSRNACRDKARHLKVLIDQYSVQISTLESQLAFWQH
jgi:phage shock protein A